MAVDAIDCINSSIATQLHLQLSEGSQARPGSKHLLELVHEERSQKEL